MNLQPTFAETRARAAHDLRAGLCLVLETEAGPLLGAAIESLAPARLAALAALGPGLIALTARRAETLKIAAYDGDLVRLNLPPRPDPAWLAALADPAADLSHPLKGPFAPLRGAEGATGPAPARALLRLAKEAALLPAVLLIRPGPRADLAGLTRLPLALWQDLSAFDGGPLADVAAARLPLAVAAQTRLHVFRPEAGGVEHYALEIGSPARVTPVLARLHSACFTGDVLGSLKCDCGPQLQAALAQMGAEGAGVLLYLNQEGRGIGLANKMRAYALQDQGFDTVEANHRLGFEDDERDFRIGAGILRQMGFAAVRLLTNNPKKVAMMEAQGLHVAERVPLIVGARAENARYLATKAAKSGHLL